MKTSRKRPLRVVSAVAPLNYVSCEKLAAANVSEPSFHPFINAVGSYPSLGSAKRWPKETDDAVHKNIYMSELRDMVGDITRKVLFTHF